MTKFYLSSWPIEKNGTGDGYAIHITQTGPLGKYIPVEAEGLKGAMAAFNEFEIKGKLTGKPMALMIGIARGERKPPGFDKWTKSHPVYLPGDGIPK